MSLRHVRAVGALAAASIARAGGVGAAPTVSTVGNRVSFTTVLAAAMAASTFMLVVFGVFADELIEEFGVERWQVGILVTAAAGCSALLSPPVGRLVDAVGARRGTVLALAGAGVALGAVGGAPSYPLLVAAAVATAVAQAMANPATNKLIAEHVGAGRRGVVTGLKQSGVQIGVFVGGLTLPVLGDTIGWRAAVGAFALAWVAFAGLAQLVLPPDPAGRGVPAATGSARRPVRPPDTALPPLVRRVTVYGFLLGAGGSTIFTYLPLYAEEVLGFSDRGAGAAVAATGFVGIAARIGWGRAAELRLGALRSLRWIAGLAVLSTLLLLAARPGPSALVWGAAIVAGLSASAWNAVGMLAIIQGLPSRETGRASGVVLAGFFTGLALGAPAFGWSVDATGSYVVGWSGATVLFLAALPALVRVGGTARERAAVAGRPPDAGPEAPR